MGLKTKIWAYSIFAATLAVVFFVDSIGGSVPLAQTSKTQDKHPTTVAFSVQVNSAPLFESQEGWGPGYTKAIGHGPGVVVGPGTGNPNVFAQQFSAKPDEPFKVIARASSVSEAKSKGRIQINWVDKQGEFISVSSKVFEVMKDENVFEYTASAPPGTASGTLYVVADGPYSVVRYTEMRLLGSEGRNAPRSIASPANVDEPTASAPSEQSSSPFPKPPNLTPLDGSGRALSVAESQYYFYHAVKAMKRRADERNMDFIKFVMPADESITHLLPAIQQLRAEGIKVLAYEPQRSWPVGVDTNWYWQNADSHWTEAAVRLAADEILTMWSTQAVANRPFSEQLMTSYANGFPIHTTDTPSQQAALPSVKHTP